GDVVEQGGLETRDRRGGGSDGWDVDGKQGGARQLADPRLVGSAGVLEQRAPVAEPVLAEQREPARDVGLGARPFECFAQELDGTYRWLHAEAGSEGVVGDAYPASSCRKPPDWCSQSVA